MNQTQTNAKEPRLLGDGGRKDPPLLNAGKRPSTAPKRLISAGEKAMVAAVAADAEVRKSLPPQAKGKAPEKEGKGADPEIAGWMNVVGHGI